MISKRKKQVITDDGEENDDESTVLFSVSNEEPQDPDLSDEQPPEYSPKPAKIKGKRGKKKWECTICKETGKAARLLVSCGHSYCAPCIDIMTISDQEGVKCSRCNKVSKLIVPNYDLSTDVKQEAATSFYPGLESNLKQIIEEHDKFWNDSAEKVVIILEKAIEQMVDSKNWIQTSLDIPISMEEVAEIFGVNEGCLIDSDTIHNNAHYLVTFFFSFFFFFLLKKKM